MDRVTRRPLFGAPYQARISGLALDVDRSHTYELVGSGHESSPWEQDEWRAGSGDPRTELDIAGAGSTYRRWTFQEGQWAPQTPWIKVDKEEEVKAHFRGAPTDGSPRPIDRELWGSPQGQEMRGRNMSMEQWASTSGESRNPKPAASEENAVDREQIDFQAARKQFLSLENSNSGVPPAPQFKGAVPQVSQIPKAWNRPPEAKDKVVAPAKPPRKMSTTTEVQRAHTSWSHGAAAPWAQEATPTPQEKPEVPETPIEREIRLALEREEALREQRGLRRATSHQELVQIPARPPLLMHLDLRPDARPERRRASLYVLRDLEQETQREAEHRRDGLQLGRASTPDSPPESPSPALRRAWSSDSLLDAPSRSPSIPDADTGVRKVNRIPPDAYHPFLNPSPPRFEGVRASSSACSPGSAAQVSKAQAPGARGSVLESRKFWSTNEESNGQGSRGPRRSDGAVVKKSYFFLRPLRFGVPDVPPGEKAPHVQALQDDTPAWRRYRSQSSELLEKEVESVLRRERELVQERLSLLYPEVFSTTPDFGENDHESRSSSRASGTTGSYSFSEPVSFTPTRLNSSLVWTAEAPAEASRRKEQWYAGLNPSDHINSEQVLESTRVPRRQNLMAKRWEAGIYVSEDED